MKKEKNTVVAALITSLLLIGLISAFVTFFFFSKFLSKTTVVKTPNLVGLQVTEARELLSKYDIQLIERDRRFDTTLSKDTIISQEPIPDMEMKAPGEIKIVVSNGQESVSVPDVKSNNFRDAKNILEQAGLLIRIVYEPDPVIPVNYVTRQTPEANASVAKNSEVIVYVSNGPDDAKIKVPNLVGMKEDEARKILRDSKLTLGKVSYMKDDSQKNFVVLSQSLAADNEVSYLTKINITVNNTALKDNNTKYITIDISNKGALADFIVRVEVEGEAGKSIVHNERHNRSEKEINLPVQGKGNSIVRVYIDDKLDSEMVVDFDGEA